MTTAPTSAPAPPTPATAAPLTWTSTTHVIDTLDLEIRNLGGRPDQALTIASSGAGDVRITTAAAIYSGQTGDWHGVLDELERIGRQIVRDVDLWRQKLAQDEIKARAEAAAVDPCGGGDLPAHAEEVGA